MKKLYLKKTFLIIFIFSFSFEALALTSSVSSNVNISASVPSAGGGGSGGGGGGGGGSGGVISTSVTFSGRAYPLSSVTLLKNGQFVASTVSGPDANFSITLNGLLEGNYIFTIYTTDSFLRTSNPFSVTLYLSYGVSTLVSGIFLTPTIAVDKQVVKKGDNVTVFGKSSPLSDILIEVNSENQLFFSTKSDSLGSYLFTFDTSSLEFGDHNAKSKSKINQEISSYSKLVGFKVGLQNEIFQNECNIIADINKDCKINLVDFSILAYWYKRSFPPKNIDLNSDGIVNLSDFSIMAFYWTG